MIPQMNFLTRVYPLPQFSSVNFTQGQSDAGQQKVLYYLPSLCSSFQARISSENTIVPVTWILLHFDNYLYFYGRGFL